MEMLRTVFGEGFRVFFLAGMIFAIAAIGFWAVHLGAPAIGGIAVPEPFRPLPFRWHAHEMIWGYGAAVLGGFFLTAVPNWTGGRGAALPFLATVAGLWLLGRLAVSASGFLPPAAVAVADLAYLPTLGLRLVQMILRRPKRQNIVVLSLLGLLFAANLSVHLDWTGLVPGAAGPGIEAGLLTLAALIAIIGGRIIPAFTTTAMRRAERETRLPRSRPALDLAAIAGAIALPAAILAGLPDPVPDALSVAVGAVLAARLAGWRGGWTRHEPLLWSMHLAYAALAIGYIGLGLSGFGVGDRMGAVHVLGIGAIGGMTLAVMCRASLGHTGRAMAAPAGFAAAMLAVMAAAALRWAVPWTGAEHYLWAMLGSAALWILAFALVLRALWRPLVRPRPGAA